MVLVVVVYLENAFQVSRFVSLAVEIDRSKVTEKQLTNHCNLYILTTNHITKKLTNQDHDQKV